MYNDKRLQTLLPNLKRGGGGALRLNDYGPQSGSQPAGLILSEALLNRQGDALYAIEQVLETGKKTLKSINDEFDYKSDVEKTEALEKQIQKENETSPVEKTGKK